jgi:hypothetical protein
MKQIVGLVLVRNEDVFVEQAIRNVADFCDRIHVVDHVSDDSTWEIIRSLARELDHIDARRSRNAAIAKKVLESYTATETWVFGVDGDELYDPAGLAQFRRDLVDGAHADVFRVKAHVLNCDRLDEESGTASGWLAPPSRPVTKLFNFAAVESWSDSPEPFQGGRVSFNRGYHWECRRDLADGTSWATDPLRCLHVCFLRRSSRDQDDASRGRTSLAESGEFDRGLVGSFKRLVRPPQPPPQIRELQRQGKNWKLEWYTRGERVTVDATPFLGS